MISPSEAKKFKAESGFSVASVKVHGPRIPAGLGVKLPKSRELGKKGIPKDLDGGVWVRG